jgi:hypothetical protein
VPLIPGNNYPYAGNKGSFGRGGLSGTGFVHGKMIPESARGYSYEEQMHVTDWLPNLMGLATNNKWTVGMYECMYLYIYKYAYICMYIYIQIYINI